MHSTIYSKIYLKTCDDSNSVVMIRIDDVKIERKNAINTFNLL